ncbi:MAG: DMT family transporter [Serpentinimonas sp.]|jgi:drug/metabolite transporter (DMT)-like permease|nr:DMT family transporter [Serpentinimonas sp.]
MNQRLAAEFVVLAAIWGSSFLFMRAGAFEFGVVATAGMRVIIASAVLMPLLFARGQWPTFRQHAGPILLLGLLNSALPFLLFSYALLSITTGLSAIMNATVPLFGAVIAWLWLGEKLTRSRVLGLVVGFVGVAMLSWSKASFAPGGTGWAIVACLGATVSYGVAASFTKRYLTGVAPLASAAGSQLGASLFLLLPTVYFWPSTPPSFTAWGALLAVGVVCTALAYISFFRLIAKAGPSKTLTVTFLIPLFALFYGALLLGESITLWMVVGGSVILGGVALATGFVSLGRRPAA